MDEANEHESSHWLTLQSAGSSGTWGCRIESVAASLPPGG